MTDERAWIPGRTDLDWIRIDRGRAAAGPRGDRAGRPAEGHPDHRPGGRSRPVGPGRWPTPDRRGRDCLRLRRCGSRSASRSMAPSSRSIRTPNAPTWRVVGGGRPVSRMSASRSSTRALDAFERDDPALSGPFDLAFIDALKPEYGAYLDALTAGRLAPTPWCSPTTSCGAVASLGRRPWTVTSRAPRRPRIQPAGTRGRSLHVDDPARRRRAARRDVARVTDAAVVRIRVRLFAIQRARRHARGPA